MRQLLNSLPLSAHSLNDATFKPDPLEVKSALYQTIGHFIPAAAITLALIHGFYTIKNIFSHSSAIRMFVLPLDGLSTLFFLAMFWIGYKKLIPIKWSHTVAGIFGLITLGNILLLLALSKNPLHSINLLLLIITIGATFLSWQWFWLIISVGCCGWLAIALNAPINESWRLFGVGLAVSVTVSMSLQQIRQITYKRLHELAFLNKAKEEHLLQAQSLLEERVERRTHELALLNFELQDEVMRRHQVEEQLKQEELILKKERNNLEAEVIKRTAALSKANIQLKQAMNMRDAFVANMSHELRTPLNSILGNAEILQETLYGPLNARQHNAVNRIESSGRHLLSLISDILDVSKIESGKFQVQLTPVNISALCRSSLSMVKVDANNKQIELSLILDPTVKTVILDSRRMKQALVNLLSNAVKFTPTGGRVGLIVRGQPGKQQLRLMVWDTGIGIKNKDLQQLFEPFVQLDSSLAKEHEGTGLGLSLARQLVELHGGSIGVKSQIGKGSLFVITLPWAPATRINFSASQTRNAGISAEIPTPSTPNALPFDAEPSEIIEWVRQSANSLSPLEPVENAG